VSASVVETTTTDEQAATPGLREGAFGNARSLSCRECGHQVELGPFYACPECFGPLEVAYHEVTVTRAEIEAGPRNIWRYKALLPVPTDIEQSPNTEPGFTRLLRAGNLGRELGITDLWVKDDSTNPTNSFKDRVVACALSAARELHAKVFACPSTGNLGRELGITALWVKDDSTNPTNSFKDRVVACALSAARELHAKVFACPSTGNLANAVAAAGARAGMKTVVFIPADLEKPKQVNSAVYTDSLVAVNGSYDDVNKLASEIAGEEDGWAFVNVNVRPYYAEGSKTLGYEIAEQLGWRLPDQVVIPVASGSQLTKVHKAFQELIALGLVEEKPYRVYGAQAQGCSPVSTAFKAGVDAIRPVRPDTIAKSLAIGNPADGIYVLDICRQTGGAVEDVTDDEVRAGILLLARTEGIFTETAGGTTTAVLKKLVETGQLDPTLETVIINTGMGLKTLDAVADQVGPAATIDPSYSAFAATGIA
jgi:threonine synthase